MSIIKLLVWSAVKKLAVASERRITQVEHKHRGVICKIPALSVYSTFLVVLIKSHFKNWVQEIFEAAFSSKSTDLYAQYISTKKTKKKGKKTQIVP